MFAPLSHLQANHYKNRWQAAIFDLDGTLLNSMHVWRNTLYQLLEDHGINPPEDLINMTKTLGMHQALAHVIDTFNMTISLEEASKQFNQRMLYAYQNDLQLKPHGLDYLHQLNQQAIPMVIATATNRPLVMAALDRLNLTSLFQFVLTVEEIGIGKHDPAIFLSCCQKLNLKPANCCVFEDSLQAIITANHAGFTTVAIDEPTAILEKPQILENAHYYIHQFKDITEI